MMPSYKTDTGYSFDKLGDAIISRRVATANPEHHLLKVGCDLKNPIYEKFARAVLSDTYTRSTLFKEVVTTVREPSAEIRSLLPATPGKKRIAAGKLADLALDALTSAIENAWDPKMRHVILFSSGYDSRLLAGLIRKLHKRRGNKWLGKCRFCCFEPETGAAKTVFDYIGLPQGMWLPIKPGVTHDYYAGCLQFGVVGKHLSEAARFWGGPLLVQRTLEGNFLTEPTQGMTALFSDETLKWNRLAQGSVAWFLGCYLFDNPGIFPGRPDVKFSMPFVSLEWLRLLTEYYVPIPIDDFKLLMARHLDPELANLNALPNFRFQERVLREKANGHLPQQLLTLDTAVGMETHYQASWYAKQFGPSTLGYPSYQAFPYWNPRNTHYIKAAIYGYLRNRAHVFAV